MAHHLDVADEWTTCAFPIAVRVTVRVWREVMGDVQGLFTFAGTVEPPTLRAVMQRVRRLTDAVPGHWRIDVIATGLDGPLLAEVEAALGELHRAGRAARLAHAPRRRRPSAGEAPISALLH